MSNEYFNHDASFTQNTLARAQEVNQALSTIAAGFDKLPESSRLKLGTVTFGTAHKNINAYRLTLPHKPDTYALGMRVSFYSEMAITGAATLDVCGPNSVFLGIRPIKRIDGTDLRADDIPAASVPEFLYQGDYWILQSAAGDLKAAQDASGEAQNSASEAENSSEIAVTKASEAQASAEAAALSASQAQAIAGIDFTAEQFGLGNVDNTADTDKPISTAAQQALNGKADKNPPIYVTEDTTATNGNLIGVDCSGSSIVITAPINPTQGTAFRVADSKGQSQTNTIRVEFGLTSLNGTANDDYLIDIPYHSMGFVFDGTTWRYLP